jgi:hypothetical protein
MSFFKKSFVATALSVSMLVPLVSLAQTDNSAIIAQLLAQIKALQEQVQKLQSAQQTPAQWCYTFDKNLKIGDQGADMRALGTVLRKEGFTSNFAEGQSDPISDDGVFIEATASAVTGFQEKYKSEILSPVGLQRGSGYVGPSTRKKLNSLYGCGGGVIPPVQRGIVVTSPQPNQLVSSPLKISGYVQGGGWGGFEGEVGSVVLEGPYGDKMGTAILKATTDWMKPQVYFEATLAFNLPSTSDRGTLVFTNSDPSGLPGTGRTFRLPVRLSQASTNQSPVINGVTGPTSLRVGEQGTWTVSASDPNGGTLNYQAHWGDVTGPGSGVGIQSAPVAPSQSTTFTHVYSSAGTYYPVFVVTNQYSTAETSISVNVGGTITVPALRVLSPNGGETWAKGTTRTISWSDNVPIQTCPVGAVCTPPQPPKFYNISLIKHYIPSCTGVGCPVTSVMPYTIASYVPGFSYNWPVGKIVNFKGGSDIVPDGSYNIQICQYGTSICDTSNSYFKITSQQTTNRPPKIVGFPAIPSNIQPGQQVSLRWSATDADYDELSWNVSFSDGPVMATPCTSNPILPVTTTTTSSSGSTSSSSGDSSTGMIPPMPPVQLPSWVLNTSKTWSQAGNYTVVATVNDCSKGGSDTNSFVITVGNEQKPFITVTSPNGGETYENIIPVRWTSQNIQSNVTIQAFFVGKLLFTVPNVSNTGSKDINLADVGYGPNASANVVYIKVCDTNNVCDMSDQPFEFRTSGVVAPLITVTSPNGGETLQRDSNYSIEWKSPMLSYNIFDISLIPYQAPCPPGMACILSMPVPYTIAKSYNGTSYSWNVGKVQEATRIVNDGSYYIQICQSGTSICDKSDNYFKIATPSVTTQTLSVERTGTGKGSVISSPTPGINCGSDCSETFTSSPTVTLYAQPEVNSTFAGWSGCNTASGVTCVVFMNGNKAVTATFTSTVPQQSITVISPNGGEQWQTGRSYPITWNATNLPSSAQIRIELIKDNYSVLTLAQTTNDGTEPWAVPTNITLGSDYKIKVSCVMGDQLCAGGYSGLDSDMSNAPFSIVAVQPATRPFSISVDSSTTNKTVAAGIQQATFANYLLDATLSSEDIKITKLPLKLSFELSLEKRTPTDIFNCQLFDGNTTLNNGNNIINPYYSVSGFNIDFNLDNPLTIPKGATKLIPIKCSVLTNPIIGNIFSWGISSSVSISATGATSGVSITPTINPSNGPTVTIAYSKIDVDRTNGITTTDIDLISRRLLNLIPYVAFDQNDSRNIQVASRVDVLGSSLDVDNNGTVNVATDLVYINRYIVKLVPTVPPDFRQADSTIPTDSVIENRIEILKNTTTY